MTSQELVFKVNRDIVLSLQEIQAVVEVIAGAFVLLRSDLLTLNERLQDSAELFSLITHHLKWS